MDITTLEYYKLLLQVLPFTLEEGSFSISRIQREFRTSYATAVDLKDQLLKRDLIIFDPKHPAAPLLVTGTDDEFADMMADVKYHLRTIQNCTNS